MNLIVASVMILIAGLLVREWVTVMRAQAPVQTRLVLVGAEAGECPQDIPRILWTYWHSAPPPAFVQACLANWRRHAPDHTLRLLDRDSILSWLPGLRADFDQLPPYRQADWLRVQLLARHGGVWMDASMLLSRDLGWLHDVRARSRAEYVGFYIDRYTTRAELPVVENWFMASVPAGGFVCELAAAFDRALDEGAESLLQRLREQGRHAGIVQGLSEDFQRYLLMHVVIGEMLDRAPQAHRLALLRAEDGPYAWLAGVGWRKRHLYARLALTHCPRRVPALIKLRGGDRMVAERNWLKRRWLSGSALIELIGRPDARR